MKRQRGSKAPASLGNAGERERKLMSGRVRHRGVWVSGFGVSQAITRVSEGFEVVRFTN